MAERLRTERKKRLQEFHFFPILLSRLTYFPTEQLKASKNTLLYKETTWKLSQTLPVQLRTLAPPLDVVVRAKSRVSYVYTAKKPISR